ncbi:protein prenyltransferase alpha subunit repeat-containing protein 1-A-like [Salvia splendens]|uniref:protein prenyltransferase alpha subunit repeat-containing protein 1-A-like n=1 Tax=Salvia splendens TaxID=180675 RepID=UPI001C276DF9|nr:protein prenyltransferase alpha subunit repeat-containing protein 1-A-like [Salvia splendens]XP_042000136.1 protein prenyltransferase alpha subunit repeat-containing protein 1-A-like [Salvia splendens]XP_042000142.1 protein prenyltransferase alpha subunit repeat-containing protein 1-A-like [Salvia splendens]
MLGPYSSTMNVAAVDPSNLLIQLEGILESDPLIDEVGFIHPTQFAFLSEDFPSSTSLSSVADGSLLEDDTIKSEPALCNSSDTCFWHHEHKLGISTLVLVQLYRAAKDAFMDSHRQCRMLSSSQCKKDEKLDEIASVCSTSFLNIAEIEVMRHSKALLLLSSDFGTAWNFRKLIVSKKQLFPMFMDELLLSTLVLSYSPKSERAWSHRRWVIKMIAGKSANLPEIVERESELVKKIVENSKMNYRAWNHRCWLVSYMSDSQVLLELHSSRDWAALHVADNSCFHFRARLLVQMIENSRHYKDFNGLSNEELQKLWKEELDWDAMLIRLYVGRESLWLHRRFLSLIWMKHLAVDGQSNMFVKDELKLFQSCTIIPDNEYGEYQAQTTFSATYITWLAKQMPESFGVVLKESSQFEALKLLLDQAEKSFLWDSLNASTQ